MATHSSILAWRIPGTEEPGGLPSVGSHRVGHDLAAAADNTEVHYRALLQGIIPIQGLNPGLQYCRKILYHLSMHPSKTKTKTEGEQEILSEFLFFFPFNDEEVILVACFVCCCC